MIAFVKQHAPLIAAILMIWFTYSTIAEEPEGKAAERKKLSPIPEASLAIRAPDAAPVRLVDPYRFTSLGAEDWSAPAASSKDARGGVVGPGAGVAAGVPMPLLWLERAAAEDAWANEVSERLAAGFERILAPWRPEPFEPVVVRFGAGAVAEADEERADETSSSPEHDPEHDPILLWVDAVLALPDGGQARVSGETVRVGEEIPGLDDAAPPRLLRVDGLRVEIGYRDAVYEIALDDEPLLADGRAPTAPAEDAEELPR